MSDYDRNVAARGFGAARAIAIDAGLRAYMIRVYNYMAAGVALTGVVAWLTFNAAVQTTAGGTLALTSFGQTIYRRPGRDRAVPCHARPGVLHELPDQQPAAKHSADAVHGLCGIARRDAVVGIPDLHPRLDRPHLLHLGGVVRCVEPVRLHHAARSLAGRLVPGDGLVRLILAMLVNIFLKSPGLEFAISAIGVLIFAGLTAWDTQQIKEMYSANDDGTVAGRKAVMGALTLYLDFINLFLFLLRFMGDRR